MISCLYAVHCLALAKVELRVEPVDLVRRCSTHGRIEAHAELLVLDRRSQVLLRLELHKVCLKSCVCLAQHVIPLLSFVEQIFEVLDPLIFPLSIGSL